MGNNNEGYLGGIMGGESRIESGGGGLKNTGILSLEEAGTQGVGGDDNWDDVTLLLNGDDATIEDVSSASTAIEYGTSVSRNTNTSTVQYGSGSLQFDESAGDAETYISYDGPNLGTGDFTVEMWWRPDALPLGSYNDDENIWDLRKDYTNHPLINYSGGTGAAEINLFADGSFRIRSTASLTASAWHHIALVRSNGLYKLFVGGVSQGTYDTATAVSATKHYIGRRFAAGGNGNYYALNANLDDFRFTPGVVRYTADFTPPTKSFPTSAATITLPQLSWGGITGRSVLTDGSAAVPGDDDWDDVTLLLDGSSTTTDVSGATTITSSGVSSKPASGTGGAGLTADAYGDPNGYVLAGSSAAILATGGGNAFGFAGDFTLEAWVYLDGITTNHTLFRMGNNSLIGHKTSTGPSAATTGTWVLYLPNASDTSFGLQNQILFTGLTTGAWKHIAVTKSGNTYRGFVNGIQTSGNIVDVTAGAIASDVLRVGLFSSFIWNGKMQDVRFTKGVARYTATFTPPTESFPTSLPVAATPQTIANTGIFTLEEIYDLTKSN